MNHARLPYDNKHHYIRKVGLGKETNGVWRGDTSEVMIWTEKISKRKKWGKKGKRERGKKRERLSVRESFR